MWWSASLRSAQKHTCLRYRRGGFCLRPWAQTPQSLLFIIFYFLFCKAAAFPTHHSKSQLISSASLPNSSRVRVLSAVNRANSSCTRGILCAGMPMCASSFFVNGGFFAVRPSRDTASGSMPQISFAILHPSCIFLHYNRRRRKKPEKSQNKGGVYRTVKSFLCRQGRGAGGTLDVLLCFGSLNLCLLPKNWSVRLQFQKKCLFCCRKIV